jgi:hypothetical protein
VVFTGYPGLDRAEIEIEIRDRRWWDERGKGEGGL